MYKEKEVINAEIRTYTITTSCPRIQLPDHLSTLALKINTVNYYSSSIFLCHTNCLKLVELSYIYNEFKDAFDDN